MKSYSEELDSSAAVSEKIARCWMQLMELNRTVLKMQMMTRYHLVLKENWLKMHCWEVRRLVDSKQ